MDEIETPEVDERPAVEKPANAGVSFQAFLAWLLVIMIAGMVSGMWAGVQLGEQRVRYDTVPASVTEDMKNLDAWQLGELQRRVTTEITNRLAGK